MNSSKSSRSLLLFAAAIAFACQSAYACKTSGTIDLPIGARPGAPATITWSPALAAAANAAVLAKRLPADTSAVNTGAWIGVNFSDHHILPQTSMQALAQISQAADTDICHNTDWTSIGASLRVIQAQGNAPLLTAVVWAPVNLFEGPTGYLRSDDPASGSENNKPVSFDPVRWNLLREVNTKLNNVGALNSTGTKFTLNAKTLNAQGGLRDLAVSLAALAALVADARPPIVVHPFLQTDWVDKSSNQAINLNDLLGYNNSQLVYTSLLSSKKAAYKLRTR